MNHWAQKIPLGAVACLILALFAFYPALTHAGLPLGADMEVHYWRTFELEQIWQAGEVIPRWGVDFHYGYGAPVFQFTAWGFYGLASLAGKLPGVDDILRIKIIWFLSIYLAAYGAFRFVSQRWGFTAGIVSAASFIFAPAFIFGEPLGRGALPVTLALGCFAMSLALLEDYARSKRPISGILAVFAVVNLMMAHNLSALMGAAVIGAWLIWRLVILRESETLYAFAIFVLGGLLTAFFWLPLPFEQNIIRLERTYEDPGLDFRLYFQPITTLLSPASIYDANAYRQLPRFSLGIISLILALIGLSRVSVQLIRRSIPSQIRAVIFWIIIGTISVFLVTPHSQFIWEMLPFMRIFQFPGRFLNFAAFGLAVMAAPAAVWVEQRSGRFAPYMWGIVVLLLIAQGLQATPWRWVKDYPEDAQVADYINFELETGKLATTASGEFLSQDVNVPPAPQQFLLNTLDDANGPVRWAAETYPQAMLTPVRQTPSQYAFRVETHERIAIEVFQFYFPGWIATVNGEPPPVVPLDGGGDHGFSWIIVVAGDNLVEFRYIVTDIQQIGRIVSLLAFVGLIGFVFWAARNVPRPQPHRSEDDGFRLQQWKTLAAVFLIALAGILLLMREGSAWIKSAPGEALLSQHKYRALFDDAINLIGYDVVRSYQHNRYDVALYWQFAESITEEINSFVHVVDANGQVIAQHDKLNFITITQMPDWNNDYYLRDVYSLYLPENTPSGEYQLRVGLWQCSDWENSTCQEERRIPVTVDGKPIDDGFIYLPQTLQEK